MFTLDTLIDTTAKNTKAVIANLPNDQVRINLETLIDAQSAYTKTLFATTTDLIKLTTDHLAAFTPTKTFSTKK